MEASETLTQLPLDFSVTMMNNIKIKSELTKHELNNNNPSVNMIFQQNSQQSSSAFKVVTPRKSDGKLNFHSRRRRVIIIAAMCGYKVS
jgi:hypothetical protein